MDDLTGKTLGNYRVIESIGRGGMATVDRAYQPALERYVALKVIHEGLAADDEQFIKRFRREAKAVVAFVLIFLAYLAFMAGRRQGRAVRWSELVAALGMALGLLPILMGLAMLLQPASSDPERERVFVPLFCLLPGLFIAALSGIFWALVARKR